MIKRTTIIEIITVLNIILFLYTGISKIQDYTLVKEQLSESPIMAPFAKIIAILLPVVELAVVALLVFPRWRLKGLLTTLVLMIVFTGYIVVLISTSDELPCSCGGIIEELSWQQHLIFNGVFIALDMVAIKLLKKEKKENAITWHDASDVEISHS